MTAGIQLATPGAKVEPHAKLPIGRAGASFPATSRRPATGPNDAGRRAGMISRFFIERPVLANVLALVMVLDRRGRAAPPAGRAISERRAADRSGHDALSRRQRADADRHRRPADRAAGQRRPEHDLHAVDQRRRRHLYADRHLRDRHGPRPGAGAGAEPRRRRDGVAAAEVQVQGVSDAEEVHRDAQIRHAVLARQPIRQPVPVATTPSSTCRTSSRGCPASATSSCSAPANTRCGSGSIPTCCRRAG